MLLLPPILEDKPSLISSNQSRLVKLISLTNQYIILYQGLQSDDSNLTSDITEMAFNLASDFKSLLNLLLSGEDQTEEVGKLAKNIATSATNITKGAEQLKEKDFVSPDDPVLKAENELNNAAQIIEMAARRLAELKPRKEVEESLLDELTEDMTFDDLIIESAKSIAVATSSLIQAANNAQKELIEQGKVQKNLKKVNKSRRPGGCDL